MSQPLHSMRICYLPFQLLKNFAITKGIFESLCYFLRSRYAVKCNPYLNLCKQESLYFLACQIIIKPAANMVQPFQPHFRFAASAEFMVGFRKTNEFHLFS